MGNAECGMEKAKAVARGCFSVLTRQADWQGGGRGGRVAAGSPADGLELSWWQCGCGSGGGGGRFRRALPRGEKLPTGYCLSINWPETLVQALPSIAGYLSLRQPHRFAPLEVSHIHQFCSSATSAYLHY
jgi:hypothetical protein